MTERVLRDGVELTVAPHPSLHLGLVVAHVKDTDSPPWLGSLLRLGAEAPVSRSEAIRKDVRDMLRHGGYKPTGRGKPASEYLAKAAQGGCLASINVLVDANNAVSLHSGLPISVVDLDRLAPPLRVDLAASGSSYAFNTSGQIIDVSGLLCLHDRQGPCANAVKDSQRTKTHSGTQRALALVWGCVRHERQTQASVFWLRELLERAGAQAEIS